MSVGHIVVGGGHMADQGMRVFSQIPSPGHLIVGGGHFLEQGGRLIQEIASHVSIGSALGDTSKSASGIFEKISTDSTNFFESGKVFFQNPTEWRPISTGCDFDSRAWESRNDYLVDKDKARDLWSDFKESHLGSALKEGALTFGCAAANDLQGAIDHGFNCMQELDLNKKETREALDRLREARGTWNDNAFAIPEIGTWQNDGR